MKERVFGDFFKLSTFRGPLFGCFWALPYSLRPPASCASSFRSAGAPYRPCCWIAGATKKLCLVSMVFFGLVGLLSVFFVCVRACARMCTCACLPPLWARGWRSPPRGGTSNAARCRCRPTLGASPRFLGKVLSFLLGATRETQTKSERERERQRERERGQTSSVSSQPLASSPRLGVLCKLCEAKTFEATEGTVKVSRVHHLRKLVLPFYALETCFD